MGLWPEPGLLRLRERGGRLHQLRVSVCVRRQRCDELHPGFRLVLHRRQPEVPLLDRGALFLEFHDQAGALRRAGGPALRPGGPAARGPGAAELQRPGVPAYAGGGAGDGAHHPGDGTDRRPQLRRRQPAPVHLHVPGHPVSARTGHHPALGNRLRKMNRENRLGGSASQPVSFCFFLDFFTCDKGFAFAAIRRDSLSMWV